VDNAFGHESVAGFIRVFEEAGGRVLGQAWAPAGTSDYLSLLGQIPPEVDALFLQFTGPDASRALAAIRDMGIWEDVYILGGTTLTDEHILFEQGEAALGVYSSSPWLPTSDAPHVRAFADAFYARFGRVASGYAMEAYAGLTIIEAAIHEAGGFAGNFAAVLQALRTLEVETPKGPVVIDQFLNPVQNVHIRRVERLPDGTLANVHVHTFSAVSQFWRYDPEEFLTLPRYDKYFNTAEHYLSELESDEAQ